MHGFPHLLRDNGRTRGLAPHICFEKPRKHSFVLKSPQGTYGCFYFLSFFTVEKLKGVDPRNKVE